MTYKYSCEGCNCGPDYLGVRGRSFPSAISDLLCHDFRTKVSRNEIAIPEILIQPTWKA